MASKLWCIYHVDNCPHLSPPTPKYVAIVCKYDSRYWGFIINSKLRRWCTLNQERLEAQIKILKSEHERLPHDSYINCYEIRDFFESYLASNQGCLSEKVKEKIKKIVSNSKTIESVFRQLILK